jgi:hypothetical protein
MIVTTVTYGTGGFDELFIDNNVIEITEHSVVPDPAQEARNSAMVKLSSLGLTEEEVIAIIGGS